MEQSGCSQTALYNNQDIWRAKQEQLRTNDFAAVLSTELLKAKTAVLASLNSTAPDKEGEEAVVRMHDRLKDSLGQRLRGPQSSGYT